MNLEERVKRLDRMIDIKNNYCELIANIGCDYDGEDTVEGLKKLIDEMVGYARAAIENDDKWAIYIMGKDPTAEFNILFEPIEQ